MSLAPPRSSPAWLTPRVYLALVVAIALLAIALRWSATKVGLMSDDFMQLGMLIGEYPGEGYAPFDLYAFLRRGPLMIEHVEKGTAPWWSVPELHGTVLRPSASLLLWLDHRLLPGQVVLWHVHSMLWFGLAIFSLGLVLDRLLPGPIALLALLLFACEAGTVSPLSWLANRCVLVCASFGLLALWAHIEWRRPRETTAGLLRKHGGWVVAALMSLCISAGEYGLGILAYIAAWELLAAKGPARDRLRAISWAFVPVLLYLAVHKLLGYGTFGAEVYADPFHTPSGYLHWASKRIPKLITAAFWSIPGATIHVFRFGLPKRLEHLWVPQDASPDDYHAAHVSMAMWGVALAVLVLALARRAWTPDERESLRVVAVGGLLGLLPIAIAPAHSRLLIIAQLGACSLVAAVIVACARSLRARLPPDTLDADRSTPRWAARIRGGALAPFAALLLGLHTYGDLDWGQAYIEHLDQLQAANIAAFTGADLLDQELEDREVVILNAPSQSIGLYGEFVLASEGWPTPASWRPLSLGGEFPIVATRPAPDTLELFAVQGAWMHTAGELFFRREDQPLVRGDVLAYPSLHVEVFGDEAGHPTRVRFRFPLSLDDPRYLFVIATRDGIQRWAVPPLGGRNVIPFPRLPSVDDPDEVRFPPPPDAVTSP